jgi:large subunit ribosomal protein L23
MSRLYDIIRRPIVTEKTTTGLEHRVTFEVALDANKYQIRDAVQTIFDVRVTSVNTAIMAGKPKRFGRTMGRRSKWKKAVVTLHEDDRIDFYVDDMETEEDDATD